MHRPAPTYSSQWPRAKKLRNFSLLGLMCLHQCTLNKAEGMNYGSRPPKRFYTEFSWLCGNELTKANSAVKLHQHFVDAQERASRIYRIHDDVKLIDSDADRSQGISLVSSNWIIKSQVFLYLFKALVTHGGSNQGNSVQLLPQFF